MCVGVCVCVCVCLLASHVFVLCHVSLFHGTVIVSIATYFMTARFASAYFPHHELCIRTSCVSVYDVNMSCLANLSLFMLKYLIQSYMNPGVLFLIKACVYVTATQDDSLTSSRETSSSTVQLTHHAHRSTIAVIIPMTTIEEEHDEAAQHVSGENDQDVLDDVVTCSPLQTHMRASKMSIDEFLIAATMPNTHLV